MFIIATDTASLLMMLPKVLYLVVLPMMLLAGLGFMLQRRLGLDMPTLARLNFYFLIPVVIYHSVLTSQISGADAALVIGFALLMMATLAGVSYLAAVIRRVPREYRSAMMMSAMFDNSGNYGLPLQELTFTPTGQAPTAMAYQAIVMITQNFISFTFGVLLAAWGSSTKRPWRGSLMHIAKFPPIWALVLALITVQIRSWLGNDAQHVGESLWPFWKTIGYIREAFVAIAMLTLGAQLATLGKVQSRYPIKLTVALRLVVAPMIALALIWLLGIRGLTAEVLLLSTTTPTAVNVMLLCLEFDNHPELAARAVFYSAVISPLTVTLVILLIRSGLLAA